MKNREILFHGKREDNGEWVEGAFVPDALESVMGADVDWGFIRFYNKELRKMEMVEVARDSVAQYVGVVNKKSGEDMKIFEGYAFRYFDDEVQVVEWTPEWSRIMLHTYGLHKVKKGRKEVESFFEGYSDLDDYPLSEMTFLGNVYDNPELIARENLVDGDFYKQKE